MRPINEWFPVMKTDNEAVLDRLTEELRLAHEQKVIPYFHIGKCTFPDVEFGIDLYLALKVEHLIKEDEIKKYLRDKYGSILRAISINAYHY